MVLILAALLAVDPVGEVRAQGWARKAVPIATCSPGADCDRKWRAARAWILANTRYTLAIDRPGLLSTPGAAYSRTALSFTMIRSEAGRHLTRISVRAWCGNVLWCFPRPKDAIERLRENMVSVP